MWGQRPPITVTTVDVILAEVLLVAHPLVTRYEQVVPGASGGLQQVAVTKPLPAPVGCGVNFMVL